MKPNPFRVGLIFLGAALTSIFFGSALVYLAWSGLQSASYPITANKELKGWPARLVSILLILIGLLVIGCGIATLGFGVYRVRQLI